MSIQREAERPEGAPGEPGNASAPADIAEVRALVTRLTGYLRRVAAGGDPWFEERAAGAQRRLEEAREQLHRLEAPGLRAELAAADAALLAHAAEEGARNEAVLVALRALVEAHRAFRQWAREGGELTAACNRPAARLGEGERRHPEYPLWERGSRPPEEVLSGKARELGRYDRALDWIDGELAALPGRLAIHAPVTPAEQGKG